MDSSHLAPRLPVELYDLRQDPHERHNLATDPAHADTLAALGAALTDWLIATRDPLLSDHIGEPPPPSRLLDAQPGLG